MIRQDKAERIKLILDIYLGMIGVVTLLLFLIILGFDLEDKHISIVKYSVLFISISFIIQEIARWFLKPNPLRYLKERWIENFLALILLLDLVSPSAEIHFFLKHIPGITARQSTLIYLALVHFIIIFAVVIKALRYNYLISRIKLHPGAIFASSFAFIIIFGAILLLLPNSTPGEEQLSFINALFTSTSAVCVTGLIVVDTAKDFTLLGQIVILFLIQSGGLGVMTLTTFFAFFLSGGVSFRFRVMMKDLLSPDNLGEVKSLLVKIFIFTFFIEIAGAFLMYISMGGNFAALNYSLIYTCVFHSVSAFCNAGFSIYSAGLMDSAVISNYSFNSLIMILIILGGFGFAVLSDLTKLRPRRNRLQKLKNRISVSTKLVLSSTLILIVLGALFVFIAEPFGFNESLTLSEKIFHSLFLSVTTRTAGFNTIPTDGLVNAVVVIMLPLMWIGASPGSTGGGIKTTTISVTLLTLFNLMRGKEKVEIFGREIAQESIRKAFMVIISSLIFLGIGSFLLIWVEPDKEPLDLIFEACSAISTVGLSRNITGFLGTGGKVIIIILMFVGRIGVLTFFLAFVRTATQPRYTLPKTQIMVG